MGAARGGAGFQEEAIGSRPFFVPIFDGEGRLLASEIETVSGAREMRFSALRERVKQEKRGRGVLTTAEERINSLKWGTRTNRAKLSANNIGQIWPARLRFDRSSMRNH